MYNEEPSESGRTSIVFHWSNVTVESGFPVSFLWGPSTVSSKEGETLTSRRISSDLSIRFSPQIW